MKKQIIPDWLLSDGSFEGWSGLVLDVGESGDVVSGLNVSLAASVLSGVSVVGLWGDSVFDDVLEGKIHKSSVASFVSVFSSGAINELLLWEAGEGSVSLEDSSFDWSGGWEGPAWSAWSLVLDWGDCSLGGPIDIIADGVSDSGEDSVVALGEGLEGEVLLVVLLVGEIGEVVQTKFDWFVTGLIELVLLSNKLDVWSENSESVGGLFLRTIDSSEILAPSIEEELILKKNGILSGLVEEASGGWKEGKSES